MILPESAQSVVANFPSLLLPQKDRRQLNFCLVTLLRVLYFCQEEAQQLKDSAVDEEGRRKVYIESRLGAKALVTGRFGGGSTMRVYTLAGFEFRDTLKDLIFYARTTATMSASMDKRTGKQVMKASGASTQQLTEDIIESLASLVEFDGLETTTDPSPRSSLMDTMYNRDKAMYVQRMLDERIVPLTERLFREFPTDLQQFCEAYVARTYPNEVPQAPSSASTTSATPESGSNGNGSESVT